MSLFFFELAANCCDLDANFPVMSQNQQNTSTGISVQTDGYFGAVTTPHAICECRGCVIVGQRSSTSKAALEVSTVSHWLSEWMRYFSAAEWCVVWPTTAKGSDISNDSEKCLQILEIIWGSIQVIMCSDIQQQWRLICIHCTWCT